MYYFNVSKPEGIETIEKILTQRFSMIESNMRDSQMHGERQWVNNNPNRELCVVKYQPASHYGKLFVVQTWDYDHNKDQGCRDFLLEVARILGAPKVYEDFRRALPAIELSDLAK